MIGLPTGASLRLQVFGDPGEPLGRVEVVEYERTGGRNLFARAQPPALGTLHVTYRIAEFDAVREHLARSGIGAVDRGYRRLLYGSGRMISFRSPAGLRIEVQEMSAR
jgi:hypothetical protein